LLFVIPCVAYTAIEGWSYLDAIYFSLISLTTIGFGDFIPSVAPPVDYAINVRNDSACFQAMVDATHLFAVSNYSGLPEKCNPSSWHYQIEMIYISYRIVVFVWILFGLLWVSGLIAVVSETMHQKQLRNESGKSPKFIHNPLSPSSKHIKITKKILNGSTGKY